MMPQSIYCEVCRHSQRAVIDAALAAGESPRGLGGQYGLPTAAISRHKHACLGLGRSTSSRPRALSVQR